MSDLGLAEYLSKFGVPLSKEHKEKISARELEISEHWYSVVVPKLVKKPTFLQCLRYLFVPLQDYVVPKDADLPRAYVTSLGGNPMHQFKITKIGILYYGPTPSPGFPGS